MQSSSATNSKRNTKKTSSIFEKVVKALTSVLLETVPGEAGFEEFEKLLFEVGNEVERQILSRRLEVIANRYDTDYILVEGQRYKRHELGEVEYHSLCGSMKISR